MKIGILYICLGEYYRFFEEFYSTCEKFFLKNIEKTYYVFTDSKDLLEYKIPNVIFIKTEDEGWPNNTLYRFDFFKSIETLLKNNDYLYFFNSNYKFIKKIDEEEIIPNEFNDYLVCLIWNKVNSLKRIKYPYERNSRSEAFIPFDSGKFYYQGGMNGGRAKEYLQLVNSCLEMRKKDFAKGIIPINNDESYINKYLLNKKCLICNENYGMPEEWERINEVKAILVNKNQVLGEREVKKVKKEIYETKSIIIRKLRNLVRYLYFLWRNDVS